MPPESQVDETIRADEEALPQLSDAELIAQLQIEVAEAQTLAADYLDKLQRTAAEFQNSRRRQDRLVTEAIERASSHIIQQLLPVLDDLELAFQNTPAEIDAESEAWVEGFRQIQRKLLAILEDHEVTVIATDGPFDPSLHEAVASTPSDEVESGHIVDVLRTGYEMKGRILRPALVRVAL